MVDKILSFGVFLQKQVINMIMIMINISPGNKSYARN